MGFKVPPCFCKHQRRGRMEDRELPGFARAVRGGGRTSETINQLALGNMPEQPWRIVVCIGEKQWIHPGQFQGSGRDVGNVSAAALAAVGDMLDVPIDHPLSLVALNREGVVPELVDVLIDRGFTRRELDWIVPARTLAYRRRKKGTPQTGRDGPFSVRREDIGDG